MKHVLLQALAGTERWAIHRPVFERLVQLAARAGDPSTEAIQAALVDRMETVSVTAPPTVAVIPIRGIIEPRRSFWTEYFGGTALECLRLQFQRALADDTVKGIVFDICSPGGDAVGVEEMATEIRKARGQKPMLAVCNCRAASAAYWLGCQADEFIGLQAAADCGSVGVFCCHIDWSGMNEQLGIKPTYIFAGAHKVEGNPDEPLSPEAEAFFQSQVDDIYARFVAAVAKGRGVTPAKVKADFGQGRCYLVPQAVALGMLDRQGTLEEAIARAATGRLKRAVAVVVESVGAGDEHGPCDPNKDGTCPDGYELNDEDGRCHWAPKDSAAVAAPGGAAIVAIAPGLVPGSLDPKGREALDAQQAAEADAEAQQRDRDWLDVI